MARSRARASALWSIRRRASSSSCRVRSSPLADSSRASPVEAVVGGDSWGSQASSPTRVTARDRFEVAASLTARNKLVLPAPFGPTSPTTSPGATTKLASSTSNRCPTSTVRSTTRSIRTGPWCGNDSPDDRGHQAEPATD
jgi:hypothetical protein